MKTQLDNRYDSKGFRLWTSVCRLSFHYWRKPGSGNVGFTAQFSVGRSGAGYVWSPWRWRGYDFFLALRPKFGRPDQARKTTLLLGPLALGVTGYGGAGPYSFDT